MKLIDKLLLGLSLAFIIIGIDQTLVLGFSKAYWAFMVALVPFFIFTFRKSQTKENGSGPDKPARQGRSGKKR